MNLTQLKSKEWTDEAFMALSDDGNRYELVNGELVNMGNAGAKHGYFVSLIHYFLTAHARAQNLGVVFDSGTAFTMQSGNKRSPDCSFLSKTRLKAMGGLPTGYIDGSPDLVVEVLSPGNTYAEMHEKMVDYFSSGTQLAWLINPEEKYVLIYRQPEPDQLLLSENTLDAGEILPGFALLLSDYFTDPEF